MTYENILPTLDDSNWNHWGATNVTKSNYDFSATFTDQWDALVYSITDGSLNGKKVRIGFESLIGDNMELCLQDENWDVLGDEILPSDSPDYGEITIPSTVSEVKFMVSASGNSGALTCEAKGLYLYILDEDSGSDDTPTPTPPDTTPTPDVPSEPSAPTPTGYDCYVSSSRGLDTNKGTYDAPYKTIQKALTNTKTAGVIFIEEGIYNESVLAKYSGTADKYFTIKGAGVGKTIIDGAGKSKLFDFNGKSYINLEDITFQNVTAQWAVGVRMGNSEKYINVRNCEIKNIYCKNTTSSGDGANPLICYGEKTVPISHVTFENVYVHDCAVGWCEGIAVSGNCEYVDVINCRVDNVGNIGIDFCGNFGYCPDTALDQPRHCKAIGNVITNCNSPNATSYGLYTDGAVDILFDGNIIHDCQGGIEVGAEEPIGKTYPAKDIVVRNNLAYNCTKDACLQIGAYNTSAGWVENVKVYNNTFYNNTKGYIVWISNGQNFDIRNNIFVSTTTKQIIYRDSSFPTIDITFKNNIWYCTYSGKELPKTMKWAINGKSGTGYDSFVATTGETGGAYVTPNFLSIDNLDFRLNEISVGINRGDDSIDAGTLDLAGNKRKDGVIDIGAYEYSYSGADKPVEGLLKCYIGSKNINAIYVGSIKLNKLMIT